MGLESLAGLAFPAMPASFHTLEGVGDFDQVAALDSDGGRIDVVGACAFGVVHERVGAMDQLRGKLARHAAAFDHTSEPETHDTHIDLHGPRREAAIVARPIVSLHRLLEPIGDLEGLGAAR